MSESVTRLLQDLSNKRFWGKVEIEFRDGEVAVMRKSETIKLNNHTEDTRVTRANNRIPESR